MPAGTYYVWMKISIPTGGLSNNFGTYVGFGTTLNPNYLKPKVENTYTWVRSSVTFTLTAGTNPFIMGHGLALAKIDQIVLTNSNDSTLPSGLKVTSIREKQTKNQKSGLNDPSIIARTLSDGRINFVVSGTGTGDFTMDVFTLAGSRVWSVHQVGAAAPDYQLLWDGKDSELKPVRSGVYVARIHADNRFKQIMVTLNK
jgi:hypothetical protein